MEIEQLEIFVAVVDAGTVTGAARQVNLTQPAVSRKIQQLEEDLGVEIFERKARGVELTAAGRSLEARARELIEEVEALERETRRAEERSYFDLRIGTVDSVATYLFPRVVHPMRESFPDLELKFYTGRTTELFERLRRGKLDVVIAAYSGPPPFEAVDEIGYYDLQFYGLEEDFPSLADVEAEEGLRDFPIVQLEPLPGQPTLIHDETRSFAMAGSLATIKSLVLGGFGVGSLLHFMLDDRERQRLVRAGVPHDPDCHLYLVRGDSWRGEAEEAIAEELLGALRRAYPES